MSTARAAGVTRPGRSRPAGSAPHIIATSREPLRAGGEWVYPVQPLGVPAGDFAADDDPLRYGAVPLLLERARAAEPHFALDRRLIAMIVAICRRVDGLPLAIELAAARTATLSIYELGGRLDDRFHLLTGGRRTALPRHQTLRATFDWSYELLPEPERAILRRLAIFVGAFSLRGASTVVASSEVTAAEVVDGLGNLVAKSLVAAEVDGTVSRYRLLDTTRAYAFESSAKAGNETGSRGATLNTTGTSSSAPKPNGKRGQPPNGGPNTDPGSTTSARRSTGLSHQTVRHRSPWR